VLRAPVFGVSCMRFAMCGRTAFISNETLLVFKLKLLTCDVSCRVNMFQLHFKLCMLSLFVDLEYLVVVATTSSHIH
jgi:hypothetical protein